MIIIFALMITMTELEKMLASLERSQQNRQRKNENSNQLANGDQFHQVADNTVTKSNALARAYYRFGLVEKRIMEALISKLHPLRTDNNTQLIELSAVEYGDAFNVPRQVAYRDMAKAVDNLIGTVIRTEESNGVSKIVKFTLMTRAEYVESQGLISCKFNPDILPHLLGLREKFRSYPLKKAVNFQSSYTWRFYEILVSWAQPKNQTQGRFAGWIKHQSVDELREMLGVPKSYRWGDFQRQVLDVIAKELKEKAQVALFIDRVKTSRKITHLNISFIEEEQIPLKLEN